MAKRFDITPIAESLLGEQRSRSDSGNSDKDMWAAIALNLGIGMGNRMLAKKADAFATNEKVMASRVANENAVKDVQYTQKTRQAITDASKSDEQFFTDNAFERVKARRLENIDEATLAENGMDAFNAQIREEARLLGIEQAARFREAEKVAGTIMDTEDFEAYATLKNQRPRNVGNWLTDKVSGLFGGSSQDELDQQAIAAIEREGTMKAEKLSMLRSAYSQGLDLTSSYELADKVFQEKSPTETVTSDIRTVGENLVVVKTRQKLDKKGNPIGDPTFTKEDLGDYSKSTESELLGEINKHVNVLDQIDTFFNQEAKASYTNELLEKGINVARMNTVEEYDTALQTFAEYMTDTNNLENVYQEERMTELMKQTGDKVFTLNIAEIIGIEDPIERSNAFKDFLVQFSTTVKQARDATAPAGNTYSATNGRVKYQRPTGNN